MSDNKKYNIIYADPPWRYEQRKIPGGAEQHYPTMTLDDICNLPVEQLADKNCALFLWTTFPKLKEAFQVIDAWGFQYRTLAFLWLKQNRKADTWFYGMGFWIGRAQMPRSVCLRSKDTQNVKTRGFINLLLLTLNSIAKSPAKCGTR